jgi:hypothetical protein
LFNNKRIKDGTYNPIVVCKPLVEVIVQLKGKGLAIAKE